MKIKQYFSLEISTFLFLAITSITAGCVSDKISVKDSKDIDTLPENQRLIIGEIHIGGLTDFHVGITADKPRRLQRRAAFVDGDHFFSWRLEPGKYTITHYNLVNYFGQPVTAGGRIWVTFEVEKDSPITYIGTLTVVPQGAVSRTLVKTDLERARKKLRSKFNLEEGRISVNLMKTENF